MQPLSVSARPDRFFQIRQASSAASGMKLTSAGPGLSCTKIQCSKRQHSRRIDEPLQGLPFGQQPALRDVVAGQSQRHEDGECQPAGPDSELHELGQHRRQRALSMT
jgi:hypothetical protein